MKYGYKKPKRQDARPHDDMLRECSRELQKYFNLEDGIRGDRREIERLEAQIRQIDRQIADIRAQDNRPEIVKPGFSLSRDRRPRLVVNPSTWAAEQGAELIASMAAQSDASDQIERLQRERQSLRYDRDRVARLKLDSESAKAKVLASMRTLGCPAAGTTNY
jgi:uncharacterized protein (UPF0335 family)